MTNPLQALIDAPLANAVKINLPAGKRSAPRGVKPEYSDEIGCPKVTTKQLRERKVKAENERLEKLFDYYAGTSLTAKCVAEHMGLYRKEQQGIDKDGKTIIATVLDVDRAERQLSWRRKAAAR